MGPEVFLSRRSLLLMGRVSGLEEKNHAGLPRSLPCWEHTGRGSDLSIVGGFLAEGSP